MTEDVHAARERDPAPEPAPPLVVENLTRRFRVAAPRTGPRTTPRSLLRTLWGPERSKAAVDDVSFRVGAGELVALLGPNGAGKSTLIKMMTGILTPSHGRVRVCGLDPHRHRTRNARNIGAVFGQRTQLWWDLPTHESFSILRDIFDVPNARYAERIEQFDALLGLSAFWDTPVRHLSLGQRVRCDLAAALLHDPQVVFLDEPTIGMDVVVKEQVRSFLQNQVGAEGKTVVLTTHDMTEVKELAERVILVTEGRLRYDGSLSDLTGLVRESGQAWRVEVTLSEPVAEILLPGVKVLRRHGTEVTLAPEGPDEPSLKEALERITRHLPVKALSTDEDLESVMRRVMQGEHPVRASQG